MKKLFFQIILPVVAIAAILGFITIVNPIQQQHAAWAVPGQQQYACGSNLTVLLTPNSETTCDSNGYNHNMTSYQSSVTLKAAAGSVGAYTVHWRWDSFWCQNEDPHAPCTSNIQTNEQTGGLTGNNVAFVTASSPNRGAAGQFAGMACGYYQNDFGFYVTSNDNPSKILCGINLNNLANSNNNASWCHTGNTCQAPTVTPTTTPTSTPSPTFTPTPTVTVTPTSTITPTATPQPGEDCDGDNDNSPSSDCPTPTTPVVNICTGDSCKVEICTGDSCKVNTCSGNSCQVLGTSTTAPTQLPNTGAEGDILFGLLGLIPVGWKIRKLI